MKDYSLSEFADSLASGNPVPGGGSVAALCGVLAGALCEMVACLTVGKEKYMVVEEEMLGIISKAKELRTALMNDIENDSVAYQAVVNALSLPKSNEEEKAKRSVAIQEGLKEASLVPMDVARKAYQLMELSGQVVKNGNVNTRTDALVALMNARTAVLSAVLNVRINLEAIRDDAFTDELRAETIRLEDQACELESEVMESYGL